MIATGPFCSQTSRYVATLIEKYLLRGEKQAAQQQEALPAPFPDQEFWVPSLFQGN